MELVADLMCDFVRQRTETDTGQSHALAVFVKFFRFQFGVAGIPDEEEIPIFHKTQFLGNDFRFQQLIAVLRPADGLDRLLNLTKYKKLAAMRAFFF